MTKPEPTKPTYQGPEIMCSKCKKMKPLGHHHHWSKKDRPPERAEWEQEFPKIHHRDCHCKSRGFYQCENLRARLRAAVQRAIKEAKEETWKIANADKRVALDEREAATWDKAAVVADHVGCGLQIHLGKRVSGCATVLHTDFIQYAAEARAKGES